MRVDLYGNVSGQAGTDRTIKAMRRLVNEGRTDPTIVFLAQQLARNYDRKDYASQARAIHKYVQQHIHYVKDPRGTEMLRSPFWTLYYKAGDCDDQAVLVAALAEAIGFATRFKTIKADPSYPNEFSHVYSQIQIPTTGSWVTSDTIVPGADIGWEAEEMFGSRTWEGLGMLGEEAVAAAGTTSFWGKIGTALSSSLATGVQTVVSNYVSNYVDKATGKEPAAAAAAAAVATKQVAASGGMPSWLLPIGIVLGTVGLAVVVKRRR